MSSIDFEKPIYGSLGFDPYTNNMVPIRIFTSRLEYADKLFSKFKRLFRTADVIILIGHLS